MYGSRCLLGGDGADVTGGGNSRADGTAKLCVLCAVVVTGEARFNSGKAYPFRSGELGWCRW